MSDDRGFQRNALSTIAVFATFVLFTTAASCFSFVDAAWGGQCSSFITRWHSTPAFARLKPEIHSWDSTRTTTRRRFSLLYLSKKSSSSSSAAPSGADLPPDSAAAAAARGKKDSEKQPHAQNLSTSAAAAAAAASGDAAATPPRRTEDFAKQLFQKQQEVEEEDVMQPVLLQSKQQQEQTDERNITAVVDRQMRVAKAQAEIDRILRGPDAPFDLESEFQKVISLSPATTTTPLSISSSATASSLRGNEEDDETLTAEDDEDDDESDSLAKKSKVAAAAEASQQQHEQDLLELKISSLEQELYQAVKQQDFVTAAASQKELSALHVDDYGAVLQVNAAFYRAFSEKDFDQMQAVWLPDATATCIHPSNKPLIGSKAVLKAWKRMFQTTAGSFQRNWMEPVNIRIAMKGSNTAIITCDENVYTRRFVRGQRRQTERINKLMATNIFRKVAGKWYLTYHHASWHPESDAAKVALARGGGGRSSSLLNSSPEFTSSMMLGGGGGPMGRARMVGRPPNPSSSSMLNNIQGTGMDGILGMNNFGPLLGDEKNTGNNKNFPNNRPPPVKRIVMGSLSDLLNGNLGDILSPNNMGNNPNGNNNINSNKNPNLLPGQNLNSIPSELIHFSSSMDDDDEDDDDDDEDDDEILGAENDDDDDEDEDDSEEEAASIIQQWAESTDLSTPTSSSSSFSVTSSPSSSTSSNPKTSNSSSNNNNSPPKDTNRQSCISALRQLCNQGLISPKQKRVLLTDIITCSAKGEYSMVEVAYELLCGDDAEEDRNAAEEEFADQCRVFATSLPESPTFNSNNRQVGSE